MTSQRNPQRRTVIVLCPFWQQSTNAGVPRIERYVRWFASTGTEVCVVCAGTADRTVSRSWGRELVIKDGANLYHDVDASRSRDRAPRRRPNGARRWLAYQLFTPDPTIIWSNSVGKHPAVAEACANADVLLSSSPPESVHLGARVLAMRHNLHWIMDLRDGWLDEPLRPALTRSRLRRWREAKLERRCLERADQITVSSEAWQRLLGQRHPDLGRKVIVITNAYPPEPERSPSPAATSSGPLLYAGKFSASDPRRRAAKLLQPLLRGLQRLQPLGAGAVRLLGSFTPIDVLDFKTLQPGFSEVGWPLQIDPPIPRSELLSQLHDARGLLLLSTSGAALPAKLFEYLPTGLPILLVTTRNSAAWSICANLAQVSLLDEADTTTQHHAALAQFIDAAITSRRYRPPVQFRDDAVGAQIIALIRR